MEAAILLQENETLKQRVGLLEAEIKLWRQKVDALSRRLYGCSSEKISDFQLQLLLAGLTAVPMPGPPPPPLLEKPASTKAKTQPVRQGLPKHLETQDIVLEPEEVK